MKLVYKFLNVFLHIFHISVIAFIAFGWMFRITRLLNLLMIIGSLASWFLLERILGTDYCPITYVHWKLKEKMGVRVDSDSFVKYWLDRICRRDFSSEKIERTLTAVTISIGFVSTILNISDLLSTYPGRFHYF